MKAYDEAGTVTGKPQVIVARTVKGKGVSFMEMNPAWHGVAPKPDELERALATGNRPLARVASQKFISLLARVLRVAPVRV